MSSHLEEKNYHIQKALSIIAIFGIVVGIASITTGSLSVLYSNKSQNPEHLKSMGKAIAYTGFVLFSCGLLSTTCYYCCDSCSTKKQHNTMITSNSEKIELNHQYYSDINPDIV